MPHVSRPKPACRPVQSSLPLQPSSRARRSPGAAAARGPLDGDRRALERMLLRLMLLPLLLGLGVVAGEVVRVWGAAASAVLSAPALAD